jgi:hypothetical protein
MSYWTEVEIDAEGEFGPASTEELLRAAEPYLRDQGYAVEPVLEDLRKGLDERQTSFKTLCCADLEEELRRIRTGECDRGQGGRPRATPPRERRPPRGVHA